MHKSLNLKVPLHAMSPAFVNAPEDAAHGTAALILAAGDDFVDIVFMDEESVDPIRYRPDQIAPIGFVLVYRSRIAAPGGVFPLMVEASFAHHRVSKFVKRFRAQFEEGLGGDMEGWFSIAPVVVLPGDAWSVDRIDPDLVPHPFKQSCVAFPL